MPFKANAGPPYRASTTYLGSGPIVFWGFVVRRGFIARNGVRGEVSERGDRIRRDPALSNLLKGITKDWPKK